MRTSKTENNDRREDYQKDSYYILLVVGMKQM